MSTEVAHEPAQQKNVPVESFAYRSPGARVEVAVWSNNDKLSVTISRSYWDKNAREYKKAKGFFPEDIPVLQHALDKAHAFILDQQQQ